MSPPRNPNEAARQFVRECDSVIGCVANHRFSTLSVVKPGNPRFLIAIATPAPLRAPAGGASGFGFDARITFDVSLTGGLKSQDWHAEARAYEYRLLDRNQRELLVYHWQPGPEYAGPNAPHLHVSASLNAQVDALTRRSIDLDKLHLPTGIVTLPAFVRMLITEFQIRPLHPYWATRLNEAATY